MRYISSTPLRKTIKGHRLSAFTDSFIANQFLPHGSGINSDWQVVLKKDRATCYNTFDHMDENGMYDAYIDFSVTFKPGRKVNVRFHDLTKDGRAAIKDGLREYLEETLAESWDGIAKELEWDN